MESGKATDDCRIIGKPAVAVQLYKVFKKSLDVIQRIWPIRMSRKLDAVECRSRVLRHLVCFLFLLVFVARARGLGHQFLPELWSGLVLLHRESGGLLATSTAHPNCFKS